MASSDLSRRLFDPSSKPAPPSPSKQTRRPLSLWPDGHAPPRAAPTRPPVPNVFHASLAASHKAASGDAAHAYDPFMSTAHPHAIADSAQHGFAKWAAVGGNAASPAAGSAAPVVVVRQQNARSSGLYRDLRRGDDLDDEDAQSQASGGGSVDGGQDSDDGDDIGYLGHGELVRPSAHSVYGDEEDGEGEGSDQAPEEAGLDIKKELRDALREKSTPKSTFAFRRTHLHAPNPKITIESFGDVTLPLDDAVAKKTLHVMPTHSSSHNAGAHTSWGNDKCVIQNPAWQDFMKKVIRDVCEELEVDYDASAITPTLREVCLSGVGQQTLPTASSVKGSFANVLIAVPSRCSGGDLDFAYRGRKQTFSANHGQPEGATVVSWLADADVECTMKPITDGYRLTLHYELVHSKLPPKVNVVAGPEEDENLRRIFASWQDGDGDLDKAVFILDKVQETGPLTKRSLSHRDTVTLERLEKAVDGLGFTLALATLESLPKEPEVCLRPYTGKPREDESDEDSDESVSELRIVNVVDLEGKRLMGDIILEEEDEPDCFMPEGGWSAVVRSNHSQSQVQADGAVPVVSRTVLLIWPRWARPAIRYGRRHAIEEALDALRHADSDGPDERDFELLEYLLVGGHLTPQATRTMGYAACVWQDPSLWSRATLETRELAVLGYPLITKALRIFGVDMVLPTIEHALSWELSLPNGKDVFNEFTWWASTIRDADVQEKILALANTTVAKRGRN